jgi:hypothetical protein
MDIADRDAWERKLGRSLGSAQRAQFSKLLDILGDPPRLENITAEFWQAMNEEMTRAMMPLLETLFQTQAETLAATLPIGVDWALINEAAVTWSRQYGYDLVRGINQTTQRVLQQAIGDYYERGWTMGDLRQRIEPLFGPVRAEAISVTEVTRAASEGEQAIAKQIGTYGIELVPVWQTNNDSLVCPICGPRHGQIITDGQYPPAHPRCRCWTNHQLPEPAE